MERGPDRFVDANGVRFAVDDRGHDGMPLVLVHGFTGGRIDFADVIDELATDRRVVAWDHRGHCDSTNTGDIETYTFDQLVADMEVLVDTLELDRFHLLGHSMGGIVAMRFVVAHPARVRSLVLMDTLGMPQHIPADFMELMITAARRDGMEAVAERTVEFEVQQRRGPAQNRDVLPQRARYKLTHMDVEAYEGFARCLTAFDPLLDRLAAIRCPTTVIVGKDDTGLHAAAAELLATIEGAVEVVIEGAGHSPQEDDPEAWLAAVREHLARAER